MRTLLTIEEQEIRDRFKKLQQSVDEKKLQQLEKRLTSNPSPTVEENALGAFLEMYEPHLVPLILAFLEKGHIIDPTTGFNPETPECQMLYGTFSIDERTVNLLAKANVVLHKKANVKGFKFFPELANIETIVDKYQQILDIFPKVQGDIQISQTPAAKKFRRIYTPQDSQLKNVRLFEILMFTIEERRSLEVHNRIQSNPVPTQLESNMGVFVEMIEPQVRKAILEMQKKGYSTDASGFLGRSDMQTVQGDFVVSPQTQELLRAEGIFVETNQSGYTTIQFQPAEATAEHIEAKWASIVSMLPHLKKPAPPSMTMKARAFRKKYTSS